MKRIKLSKYTLSSLLILSTMVSFAQVDKNAIIEKDILDRIYISEVEDVKGVDKVLHAEPLYIDLIRDLGARKGEREWNIGMGLTDMQTYSKYEALIEYEWAPVNRLGLEVELPFSFYYPIGGEHVDSIPQSQLNSLKLATQYTFFVSEKHSTSMAFGYLHEFKLPTFSQYNQSDYYQGNVYNPFFILAKRWGQNFHTLNYSGPQFLQKFTDNNIQVNWQINTSFHYMIEGTRNFIGVEFNKDIFENDFDMTIRPQMRIGLAENLIVGIVTGIPIYINNARLSSFIRLIYEPGHHSKKRL